MEAALEVLVGPKAKGLSASMVSRLKQTWSQEYRNWREQRLDKDQCGYIWADGVYSEMRQHGCSMHKTMNVLNCLPKSS
jgi:putative transposase